MSKFLQLVLLLFSSMASVTTTTTVAAEDVTQFVFAGCSQPKYEAGSPYQFNIDALLASLANAAAFSSYANSTASDAGSSPAYGLVQCRGDLPPAECQTCVGSALAQLPSLCPSAAGAAVQLRGCFLRYGNDSFLGKPDTSVIYSKCGAAADAGGGYSSDLLAMRDTSLADLTAEAAAAGTTPSGIPGGGGSYRVGAAGYVQAVAQCVGDQSAKQCDDCVAAAVAELRAACGYAVAGDAYLGKCYARYWSSGISSSTKADRDADEVGKTLAIIIGLIAGVALLIAFLSFIRRAARDDDGKY